MSPLRDSDESFKGRPFSHLSVSLVLVIALLFTMSSQPYYTRVFVFLYILAFLVSISLAFSAHPSSSPLHPLPSFHDENNGDAVVWLPFRVNLTSTQTYTNAYKQVTLNITFIPPQTRTTSPQFSSLVPSPHFLSLTYACTWLD